MAERNVYFEALAALGDLGVRQPTSELRPRVRAALEREIRAELDGRHFRRHKAIRAVGTVALMVSGLVAIGVAVGAIVLLAHRNAPVQSSAAAANRLMARLAVLRRPQTAADVLPPRLKLRYPGIAIIPSLTRLVASPAGARIYLVVSAPPAGQRDLWSPGLGDQVSIQTVTTTSGAVETQAVPAADLNDARDITPGGDFATNAKGQRHRTVYRNLYDAGVVPDGVARVRWTFADARGGPGRVIDVPVRNNVAYTPLLPSTATLLGATWYATDGRVIPTTEQALEDVLATGVRPAAPDANAALPVLGSAKTMTLNDLRGKVVVLNLFASWCDPCRLELPILERTQRQIVGRRATVLGVTYLDNRRDARQFVHQQHINYPVVRDVTGIFARAYGANGIPETFVIDRHGRVAALRRYQLTGTWLERVVHRLLPQSP